MRQYSLCLLIVCAAAARAGAQSTLPDTTCSYSACALSIAPAWDGLHVIRGSERQSVANLHFFWPTDIDDVLRGSTPSALGADSAAAHARRAVSVRRAGAGFTDAGALAIGAAILRVIGTGRFNTRSQVIAGVGVGALAISVPLHFMADGELSRAVWWHNQRYAPATPTVALGNTTPAAPVASGNPAPIARPQPVSLVGTWDVEYTLDSANTQAPSPAVRRVRGRLMFGDVGADSTGQGSVPANGRFLVDFTPLFGGSLSRDVSAVASGPVDSTTVHEVAGTLAGADSVRIDLVPRMTAAGISMSGRIEGDSVSGTWIRRAACCGEFGHFRMTRVDRTPVVLAR